jgi:hypothetical protein
MGLVHLINPKLALHLVDEIYKRIGVHHTSEKASMVEVVP